MFLSKKVQSLTILALLPIALWQSEVNASATAAINNGSFSAQAAGQNDRELNECKTELQAYYGDETELNLVDRRRYQHGTRIRVAARLDADNSYFATCWVPRQDEGASTGEGWVSAN